MDSEEKISNNTSSKNSKKYKKKIKKNKNSKKNQRSPLPIRSSTFGVNYKNPDTVVLEQGYSVMLAEVTHSAKSVKMGFV